MSKNDAAYILENEKGNKKEYRVKIISFSEVDDIMYSKESKKDKDQKFMNLFSDCQIFPTYTDAHDHAYMSGKSFKAEHGTVFISLDCEFSAG